MENNVMITFLANAAVLIQFENTKFLIDGIYGQKGHVFSNLTNKQWQDLKMGKDIFCNIDYLLFTHEHEDHFSAEKTAEYLKYQCPKGIVMPKNGSASLKKLKEVLRQKQVPCVLLDEKRRQNIKLFPEKNVSVSILQTRHLDKIYWNVAHFCFLFQLGQKKILITADVDFTKKDFLKQKEVCLDAVFINPLFYHSKEGKEVLSQLKVNKIMIYHVPFLEDDKMGIQKLLPKKFEKNEDIIILKQRGQTIII